MAKKMILKLIDAVSIVIIIFSVFVLLLVVMTRPGEVPDIFGYSLFRVVTGSMAPAIPENSLIIVHKTEAEDLKEGDIISFYSRDPALAGEVNTHRIIHIENASGEYMFTTKGDANNVNDLYGTQGKDIIGKVVFSSHIIGVILRLLSNPLIFIPVLVCPLMLMVGVNLYRSISLAKQLAREEEEKAIREAVEAIRQKKKSEEVDYGRTGQD